MDGTVDLMKRFAALSGPKPSKAILGQFGLLAVRYAKEEVRPHRKTGNLERTIRVDEVNIQQKYVRIAAGGTGKIGANQYGVHSRAAVGYAAVVEFGSRRHDIFPRRKKALAWGGARRLSGSLRSGARPTHFAKRVSHPGTRAYPYMRPGAERALRDVGLADSIIQIWNDAA